MSHGYALRRNGTCEVDYEVDCGPTWGDFHSCCPQGTYCPPNQKTTKCWISSQDQDVKRCANGTWDLYYANDFFCCDHDSPAFIRDEDSGYVGCADPGYQIKSPQIALSIVASGTETPTPTPTSSATSTSTSTTTTTPPPDKTAIPAGAPSAPTTHSSPSSSSSPSSTNTGAIAGGVVGGVAGLALLILIIWLLRRRRNKTKQLDAPLPPTVQPQTVRQEMVGSPAVGMGGYKPYPLNEAATAPVHELYGKTTRGPTELPDNEISRV